MTAKKLSKSAAINAMCKSCIYDKAVEGSWRYQVEQCRSGPEAKCPCPLYDHRPVTMETVLLRRKDKGTEPVDIDALVDGLEDE